MKKLLFIFAILTSVVSFSQEASLQVVEVTGNGVVKVVPDQVVIQSRIEHMGESAAEVKAQNDEVVDRIINYLRSQRIPSSQFRTEYIRLNKEQNHRTGKTGFSANQAISIELNDLDSYETIMGGLLEAGLNRIDGVQFRSSRKEELQSMARREAVLDAREKAGELAEALDQEIGKAQRITEVETGNFQPVYRTMEMQADMSDRETIAPGEMEINIKVNVRFELK